MRSYHWKYLVVVLANYAITLWLFLKYKTSAPFPPLFAHHLVAQMYLCFFVMQEQHVARTFWVWSLLLMMAHLLGAATAILFNVANASFIAEDIVKYSIGDLLLIIATFILVIILSVKTNDKQTTS